MVTTVVICDSMTAGPLPLTPCEEEIEEALNQRSVQKIYVCSLQRLMRNTDSPTQLFPTILDLCAPWDEKEANALAGLFSELWNNTPRYELRGRTPHEMRGA